MIGFPEGPHCSLPAILENSPCNPSLDRLLLGEADDLALIFDGPVSLPRRFDARPCNDDHELSHTPAARDGACCELPKFELPSMPDACCNLCGGLRIDEVERDGC